MFFQKVKEKEKKIQENIFDEIFFTQYCPGKGGKRECDKGVTVGSREPTRDHLKRK